MSQQRQDAYLNLIKQLLNSPSEDEGEILATNRDLLDAEFLQVVQAVAEMMSEKGSENIANWLRNLRNQLAEYVNESFSQRQIEDLSEEEFQAYFQFLKKILLAILESNRDTEVVYRLFVANIDKLDNILQKFCDAGQ
ncbi:MAG: hypothetical protein HC815_37580 [Richelia sp. RM1_1_1]|nr:hypothetical protein [Richelia sp. RM1_1_1]